MVEENSRPMRISTKTWATLKELSARTNISIIDLLDLIFSSVQTQLDLMQTERRLLFQADYYTPDRQTIIRLSDACTFGIPSELPRAEVEKAFDYKTDSHGKVHDLRCEVENPDGSFSPKEKAKKVE